MKMRRKFRQDKLDPARRTGLVLCGMGGPDGPDAVEPFLRNLFSDKQIIPAPRPFRDLIGRLIARARTPKVRARYAEIDPGGGSPQLDWTRKQAAYLAGALDRTGRPAAPLVAMRYWHPFPDEMLDAAVEAGAEQFLVVPAYPQYAEVTSGNILMRVQEAIARRRPDASVHVLPDWHRLPGFLATLADHAAGVIDDWRAAKADPSACAMIFVAHSLPMREIRRGDPYPAQTAASLQGVHDLLADRYDADPWWREMPGGGRPLLAYQSRVGPVEWLGPNIVDEVRRLAAAGCRNLLVAPLSFTCEHIETLHELDIELRETAEEAGVTDYRRAEALNMDATWLDSLAGHLDASAFSHAASPEESRDGS